MDIHVSNFREKWGRGRVGSPGLSVHAISVQNYPLFIENIDMDIHVSILYPWTMGVHSKIFKWMDFSAWMLPWTLHGYFNPGVLPGRSSLIDLCPGKTVKKGWVTCIVRRSVADPLSLLIKGGIHKVEYPTFEMT